MLKSSKTRMVSNSNCQNLSNSADFNKMATNKKEEFRESEKSEICLSVELKSPFNSRHTTLFNLMCWNWKMENSREGKVIRHFNLYRYLSM